MSGIGFWELIILALIGLLVLGPERLPRVANQLGGWLGQARRMTRVMKRQLEDELDFEKELGIKTASPKKPTVSNPQYVHEKPVEGDDHYSPEHDTESIGTGVGDDLDDDNDAIVSTDEIASAATSDDVAASSEPETEKESSA